MRYMFCRGPFLLLLLLCVVSPSPPGRVRGLTLGTVLFLLFPLENVDGYNLRWNVLWRSLGSLSATFAVPGSLRCCAKVTRGLRRALVGLRQ